MHGAMIEARQWRLVSYPVSFAVEAVLDGLISSGVHAAPSDLTLAKAWMDQIVTLPNI